MFRTSLAVSLLGVLCLLSGGRVAADVEEKPSPSERPAMIRAKAVVEELAKDERHQHRIQNRIVEARMKNPLALAEPLTRPLDVSGKVEMKAVSGTRLRVGERLRGSVKVSTHTGPGATDKVAIVFWEDFLRLNEPLQNRRGGVRPQDGDQTCVLGRPNPDGSDRHMSIGFGADGLLPGSYAKFMFVAAFPLDGSEPVVLDAEILEFVVEP
jgi:hypothetical protein